MRPAKASYANWGPRRSLTREQRLARLNNADLQNVEAAITAATPILASVANKVDEAPNDGQTYSRKSDAWQKLSSAVIAGLPPS